MVLPDEYQEDLHNFHVRSSVPPDVSQPLFMVFKVCSFVSVSIDESHDVVPCVAKKMSDLFESLLISRIHIYPCATMSMYIYKPRYYIVSLLHHSFSASPS